MRKGDSDNKDIFASQTLLMPSSVGITSELRRNPNAIGYDGLGYVDPAHEKILAIAADANSPYVTPSVATGMDGTYPIARPLYMYTAGQPTGTTADYLKWIQGQRRATDCRRVGLCAPSYRIDRYINLDLSARSVNRFCSFLRSICNGEPGASDPACETSRHRDQWLADVGVSGGLSSSFVALVFR